MNENRSFRLLPISFLVVFLVFAFCTAATDGQHPVPLIRVGDGCPGGGIIPFDGVYNDLPIAYSALVSISEIGSPIGVDNEEDPPIEVTSISLNHSELSMLRGTDEVLVAFIEPRNASDQLVQWQSSDPNIVRFQTEIDSWSEQHWVIIRALSPGTATISVTTADGNYSDNCIVEVMALVSTVQISPENITLEPGETTTLQAIVQPVEGTDPLVTWSSSDSSVVSVDEHGLVTANRAGEARIIARSVQDPNKNAYSTVKVAGPQEEPPPAAPVPTEPDPPPDDETEADETFNDEDEDGNYLMIAIIAGVALLVAITFIILVTRARV